ncbi:hypothetical protein BC828DRAFT_440921 [Blastocladiella britannica]|nr:hypothetical protein BC828DRAFT_440921 [Blastocladiella britannica]
MIRKSGDHMHALIASAMRTCFERRVYPPSWRKGNVYMIPKTSAPYGGTLKDARPITLLEVLGKVVMKFFTGYPNSTRIVHTVTLKSVATASRATPKKSSIMVLNFKSAERSGLQVFMGRVNGHPGQRVYVAAPNESIRCLGVFYSAKNHKDAAAYQSIRSIFKTRLPVLRRRQMTVHVAVYILNSVIFPAALYRCKNYLPTITQLRAIDRSCCAIVRSKLKQVMDSPSVALHATTGLLSFEQHVHATTGLLSFEQHVHAQATTELQSRWLTAESSASPRGTNSPSCKNSVGVPYSPLAHPMYLEGPQVNHWMASMVGYLFKRASAIADVGDDFLVPGGFNPIARHLPWAVFLEYRQFLNAAGLHFCSQLMPPVNTGLPAQENGFMSWADAETVYRNTSRTNITEATYKKLCTDILTRRRCEHTPRRPLDVPRVNDIASLTLMPIQQALYDDYVRELSPPYTHETVHGRWLAQALGHTALQKCGNCRLAKFHNDCTSIVPIEDAAIPVYFTRPKAPEDPESDDSDDADDPDIAGNARFTLSDPVKMCKPTSSETEILPHRQKYLKVLVTARRGSNRHPKLIQDPQRVMTTSNALIAETLAPRTYNFEHRENLLPPPGRDTLSARLGHFVADATRVKAYRLFRTGARSTPVEELDHANLLPPSEGGPRTIIAYSDGSLTKTADRDAGQRGGAGVIFPFSRDRTNLGLRVPVGPYSSYYAELWAVLLAVAACPPNTNLIIFLDNKGVVTASGMLASRDPMALAKVRATNPVEWSALRLLLRPKNIELQLSGRGRRKSSRTPHARHVVTRGNDEIGHSLHDDARLADLGLSAQIVQIALEGTRPPLTRPPPLPPDRGATRQPGRPEARSRQALCWSRRTRNILAWSRPNRIPRETTHVDAPTMVHKHRY